MIPILQDKETFKSRRATWSEIADGGAKCQVTLLNPANDMFTRMPVNDHVVSDHCPAPYERCLEALLLQAGGAVPDPEGWGAFFQVSSTPPPRRSLLSLSLAAYRRPRARARRLALAF